MNQPAPVKWIYYIVAPIAFMATGLGEISSTLLFSGTSILLFFIWRAKNQNQLWASKSFQLTFFIWLFLLLGMLTLIISPSNIRVEDMGAHRNSIFVVPFFSIQYAYDFITISLRTLPVPHLIFLGTFFSLAIISQNESPASPLSWKRILLLVTFTSLITFILITAIQAPTVYFYSSTPDPRGKTLARYILLIGLGYIAWLSGTWSAQKIKPQWLTTLSVLFILLCSAYTTRSAINIYKNEYPYFVYRAELWDARDAHIAEEKALGKTQIEVTAIDTAQIDIRDIFVTKGKGWTEFVQNCASRYYQVDGLKVED
jgi:hypothetical protein